MNSKQIIISLFLMTATLSASAQRLVVSKATVDCGKVAYCKPVTATFQLRNKSTRRLKISDVRVSCGCAKAEYPHDEIPAGTSFTLKLTYDARQLGHFDKSAAVISNGTKQPLYLNMQGVVLADLKDHSASYPYAIGDLLVDRTAIEFDDVNKGENPVQEIHLLNNGTKSFTPNILHLPPYLTAIATPERLSPGHAGKIALTLNSDKLRDYGLTQTSIYLARNLGEKISSDNEIEVSAILLPGTPATGTTAAPRLTLSADTLHFDFNGKTRKTHYITIANDGSADLRITSLQMFTSGLKVTLGKREIKPGESTRLKITATHDELLKQRTRPRVLMITNDPDRSKIVIDINYE